MSLLLLFKTPTDLGTPTATVRLEERALSTSIVLAYHAAPVRLAVRVPGATLSVLSTAALAGSLRVWERAPGAVLVSKTAIQGTIRTEARERSTAFLLAYNAAPVRVQPLETGAISAAILGTVSVAGTVRAGAVAVGTLTMVPTIGTIAPSGGGSSGGYWRRWEPVVTEEPEEESEGEPVTAATQPSLPQRIGRPGPKPVPQEAEPWPPPPPIPEPEPEPAIAQAIDEVLAAPPRVRRPRKSHRYWRPGVGAMPLGPPTVILVTRYWGGLGLAMLMQRQGSQVLCATDYTSVPAKELKATEQCGLGLVQRLDFHAAMRRHTGRNVLWVFDGNDLPKEAEALRAQGELVIGTSVLSQKLEDDRDYAAAFAESVGLALPETQKFTDYDAAIAYLEARSDRAFAFKPDKQDPTATYVPLETSDPAKANDELQEYLHSLTGTKRPSFILQEVVHGVETNFDLWLRDGQPIAAFCDLESKRKLVDDLGENVGCAGDYVFSLPLDSAALRQTVRRYLERPELRGYTGTVDVNVMLVDGKPLFLENCFRFGYNAYPVLFQALATRPMEAILRDWVSGSGPLPPSFSDHYGASLSLVCDHPQEGTPIMIPQEIHESVYLYRAYHDQDHIAMVEEWPEVACVTASGPTMADAGKQCLTLAEQVAFPGKGYRTDLADTDLDTLPIPRAEALQQQGWIDIGVSPSDDEEAMTALLGVLDE